MSLVGRDIRSGLFKTLKAATLIVIEDEIENELSAHDMWQAQLMMMRGYNWAYIRFLRPEESCFRNFLTGNILDLN